MAPSSAVRSEAELILIVMTEVDICKYPCCLPLALPGDRSDRSDRKENITALAPRAAPKTYPVSVPQKSILETFLL